MTDCRGNQVLLHWDEIRGWVILFKKNPSRMMRRALSFRLCPSSKQEMKMLHALHSCTRLWNIALAHRQHRWRYERQATSYRAQQAVLTHERHLNPEIASLHSQVAQDVLRRLDKAFNEFFRQQSR
jgi:putative transposase